MSSKLNLVPEIPVVVGQSIIFLTNIFVVKKLFIDPYLKLRHKRLSATTGSQQNALQLVETAQKMNLGIDESLTKAYLETSSKKEQERTLANAKKTEIISEAEATLKKEMTQFKQELSQEIALKRSQLSSIIEKLTQDAVSKVIQ